MRERFGAKDPRSWMCRFHTQTAGCSLTAQQPYNNVVRTAIQALAGVLGGTNSLHTNSLDETLALPTDFAVKLALRTQQVIAHESGVANTIDPLGGSYFVEDLTTKMERGCFDYFRRIDELGGMVEAIEAGFPQREIMDAAYAYQRALDTGEKIVVGVNEFVDDVEQPLETLYIDDAVEDQQKEALAGAAPHARRQGRDVGARRPAPGLRRRQERDAAARRGRQDLRHGRRDLRRHARGLRDVRGTGGFLTGVRSEIFGSSCGGSGRSLRKVRRHPDRDPMRK